MAAAKRDKARRPPNRWGAAGKGQAAAAWAGVFEKLIEKVGLTGAFLVFVCIFVVVYASPQQRTEIIDLFILGHGIRALYPTLVASAVYLSLLIGQQYYLGRRIRRMEIELARLGQWKSDHQENQIGEPLHHSRGGHAGV